MKPKLLLRTLMSLIAGVLLVEANGLAQGFRTQQLLLDDDATSLPSRNTITLMAPSDGNLTGDYGLRFPNTTNLGVGSLLFVGATGATNDLSWLAAGTADQILQIDATGAPTWQTINLIPNGTADNTTLRWDATAGAWVENVNLLSDATGNTTINGMTIIAPNIPAGAAGETNVLVRNALNELVVRTFDDLIGDATLTQNAVWVGDATNHPAELAAGTTDQVLQIDATGAPMWQTINLIPDGTADNTTLRWDATAGVWVENVNLLSDATGNTTVNGTATINGATTTINSATVEVPNVPATGSTATDVMVRSAANALEVRTINDLIGDATLTQNAVWVGDATNNPAELAAGTSDQVLQIDATGAPTWQTINLIPDGTADNTTLRWDATAGAWVENVNLLSDATGNTTINGTTVTTPNIPAGADGEVNVVVRNASNELVVRPVDDLIGDATLTQNAVWVGDATNNPAELAAGTSDQVLQIDATGAPTWQTINLIPDGTTDNTTLRWDATAGAWVENVNLLSDATGNTTINGTTVTTPNIPAGADGEVNVVVRNASNELVVRPVDDLIGDATLTQNAVWVGDATNNPAELAAGTSDQVLQIDATGAPTWQTINLIPDGTADNTTLRWDATAGAWVENVNLLSDATGNTTINGTTVTTPNIPAGADGEVNVVVRNASNELVVRPVDDLIGDATLTQNAIWVGDATNNPAEVAAGTQNQVLQIDATGAPTWQTINLAYRGRIATSGSLTQVINDPNITAGAAIVVSYEDPANGARIAVDVISRNASADFTVGFSALPPNGSFINYTVMP